MPAKANSTIRCQWLIAAEDQLENLLTEAHVLGCGSVEEMTLCRQERQQEIDELLRHSFPSASGIVVLAILSGYSPTDRKFVVRVEVALPGIAGSPPRLEAHLVKVGAVTKLQRELKGRESGERASNSRGDTLLSVRKGWFPPVAKPRARAKTSKRPKKRSKQALPDPLGTLIYQDAAHKLRASQVVSLEEAFLDSMLWGVPAPDSVLDVLGKVFAELDNQCYQRASSVKPTPVLCRALTDRCAHGARLWNQNQSVLGEQRRDCRQWLPPQALPFVDLLDFAARARQVEYLPELRYGYAHGDFHGRNLQVGLVGDRALFAALFDFEDMGPENFVAWDFVKLENELKIRALARLFPEGGETFVHKVYKFETELNSRTEELNDKPFRSWRDMDDNLPRGARGRLLGLLLGVRRQAKKILDLSGSRTRARRWLHEYYFFAAMYAIYAGKFAYEPRECMAAYLSGSCAATRYVWGLERSLYASVDAQSRAQQNLLISRRLPASPTALVAAAVCPVTISTGSTARAIPWDIRFIELREYARSLNEPHVRTAVQSLRQMREAIPAAAEVVQELALALVELARLTGDHGHLREAVDELAAFEARQVGHYSRDVELLCRWGRIWKDCGDAALAAPAAEAAADGRPANCLSPWEWYEISATYYHRAYEVSQHYYPGINWATLQFMIASSPNPPPQSNNKEFANLARLLRDNLTALRTPDGAAVVSPLATDDEPHWQLATLGEACLLLGENESVVWYKQAMEHHAMVARDRKAMFQQADRIMRRQEHLFPRKFRKLHRQLRELFPRTDG